MLDKMLTFIKSNPWVLIVSVLFIFIYIFISSNAHSKMVNFVQDILHERVEYLEKDMEKQERLSKEKEETFSSEKDAEIAELQRKMSNLESVLEKTRNRNIELSNKVKELKVAREKIKTKEYTESDRHSGVLRAIELGNQLR